MVGFRDSDEVYYSKNDYDGPAEPPEYVEYHSPAYRRYMREVWSRFLNRGGHMVWESSRRGSRMRRRANRELRRLGATLIEQP